MQILERTVHTVQQTVDPHRYSSGDGCHAPVVVQRQVPWLGRAENCGVSEVAVLVAAVQFLDKVVVPVGATTVGRAMFGSTTDTCSASSRVAFGRIFTIFHLKGQTRLLKSILRPGRHVVDTGSGMFLSGFAGLTHLALWSHDCRQFADRCFSCSRVALGNLYIIFFAPPIFSAFSTFKILRELIFWGPRALTVVSARGPGVPESPGVYSQVTRHRDCAN